MNHRLFLTALLAALLMLVVLAVPTLADDLQVTNESEGGAGISGEAPPAGILAVTHVYTSAVSIPIASSTCFTTTLNVPDGFTIGDLNVGVWLTHTYRSDVDLWLTSPDGTEIDLLTDPDGSADNLNVLLDDASPNAPDTVNHTAPPPWYYVWWHPDTPLAQFIGKDAQGDWVLEVCDDAGGDDGHLYQWTLFFTTDFVSLEPEAQASEACKGSDVVYDLTLVNVSGMTTTFDLTYSSVWPYVGPATSPVLPDGTTWDFQVGVHIPWAANVGDSDVLTVTAADPTATYTDTATATTTAGLLAGWTDYADTLRPTRDHSIVYYDGKLYKIGGYDGAAQAYLDIYDIATDTWTPGADMPGARYWIDCEAIDGKIYCAGGYLSSGQTNLYIYDIATNGWSEGAPLAAYVYNYASVQLGGKYYLIGGYTGAYSAAMLAYDPTNNTWDTTLPSMAQGRRYHSAGVVGGKIYVAGGYKSPSPYYLDSVEIYDPATTSWSAGPTMPTTWTRAADGVKHDRYLILAGGDDNSTSMSNTLGWMLDTVTGTWSAMPAMDHALYGAEADSDGTNFWIVSGRLYEGGVYSYSPYTTLLEQCGECVPVSTADFSFDPAAPRPTMPVVFTGWADGSPAITFDWDFDDGTGAGQVVTHTYVATGTYSVVMTATNCDGGSWVMATHDVLVEAGPTVRIEPLALASTQCPDCLMTYTLSICNDGDQPLVYTFTESLPWLGQDPVSGTVPAGTCTDVDVIFDSTGVAPGTYTGTLQVENNDTMNPVVDVDVSLTVAGGPTAVDFTWDPPEPWIDETVTFSGTADALLPVDYAWDFGDGTIGAGQSPTHTYTAAGDYTVTMTATVCGESVAVHHVVSVPTCWSVLDEHFETAFPPAGWTVVDNGGTCVWQRNDFFATPRPNYAGGDGYCADADVDRCGSGSTMDTELRTMVLDLTGMTTATLEYMAAYNWLSSSEWANTDVSTDGGATWTNLLHWNTDHSPSGPGEWVNLDLTAYAGQANVMVRFHYYAPGWYYYWEVDQVNVGGCYVEGAAPEIVVTPTELEQTLYPDQMADQSFNIANVGLMALDWTLDEGCGTPVGWLALDPLAGTTPVGGDADVTVSFDSTGLAVGTYETTVCVDSNDPVSPTVVVEVTLIVTAAPEIAVTPPSLHSTQPPDVQVTLPLTICNVGAAPLTWSLAESNPVFRVLPAPGAGTTAPAAPVERPVITSPDQCAQYENYAGVEPIGAAEFCGAPAPVAMPSGGVLAPTDPGYAVEMYNTDTLVTFLLNNFPGQTTVGPITASYYGLDFDPSATILYALNDNTDELGTIDLATGAFTGLVSCPPGGGAANWTGLSIDADGVFWASTSTDLYIIDPATGGSTLVGPFGTGGLMIDIAINPDGQMYGHDITSDSIYQINPTTGAATLIGPTGYAANYAQGMDFDNDDGTLYIFVYTGGGTNTYGTVDLATGAVTPLSQNNPMGEFEGAIQIAGLVDIPWLSEDPLTGTLDVGLCEVVDVTFDSTGLEPDEYYAGLTIDSNDPYIPQVYVPVTLTVGTPDVVVEPAALAAELCPDTTLVLTFTVCNTGTLPLEWTLVETETAGLLVSPQILSPATVSRASRTVELSLDAAPVPGGSVDTAPPATNAAVSLVLDDGTVENNIGIGGTAEFIYLNRFTPDPGEYPFHLNQVQIYFDSTGLALVGDDIILVVYENTTGNADPAVGSNWLASFPTTVQALDAWNVYDLAAPVLLDGPGDVLIGVVALEVPGTSYWPAAMDQTVTQQRSWAGWWSSSPPPTPPTLPPDDSWILIDDYFPGNWMIRGYGETYEFDIPWLSEDPVAGTVQPGECQEVAVTFDATGMAPGDYFGALLIESNDPDTPEVTIPVTMTVLEPAAIVSVTYTVDDLEVTFDATATGAEPLAYAWDFGDDATSTDEDPVHVYAAGGCYDVSLTVSNGCGEDTWTEQICVCEPVSGLDFSWLPEFPIAGDEVLFTATAEGTEPIAFDWDFGDGNLGTGITTTHVYTEAGDYLVTVMATNCDGDYVVMTQTVTVAAECVPVSNLDFSWLPALPNEGETVTFSATADGTPPITFEWDFGDDTVGTGITATHAYAMAGDYLVTLTATNCDGDFETKVYTITVAAVTPPKHYYYLPIVFRNYD